MFSKGIRATLYVTLLGAVLISAVPAAAQEPQTATATKGYAKATSTRTVEFGKEIEFSGTIAKLDGDTMVVDSDGAETTVLLGPGTKIRGSGNGKHMHLTATKASGSRDRAALVTGLAVEVEGHGNCQGQIVAESVKFRYNPCLCEALANAKATTY